MRLPFSEIQIFTRIAKDGITKPIPQLPGTQAEVSAIDEMSAKNDIRTNDENQCCRNRRKRKGNEKPESFPHCHARLFLAR